MPEISPFGAKQDAFVNKCTHGVSPLVRSLWSGPKYNVYFFGLVRFLFTFQFSQQSQNLSTNPHVCKDHYIIGQKGLGRCKEKIGRESASESKQSWISSVMYIDLRTGCLVRFRVRWFVFTSPNGPHQGTKLVKCTLKQLKKTKSVLNNQATVWQFCSTHPLLQTHPLLDCYYYH